MHFNVLKEVNSGSYTDCEELYKRYLMKKGHFLKERPIKKIGVKVYNWHSVTISLYRCMGQKKERFIRICKKNDSIFVANKRKKHGNSTNHYSTPQHENFI